jgi:hypothetical protein
MPSRKFKEGVVVWGCFGLSATILIVFFALARLWWFLSLAVILFLFIAFQGVIFNLFKRRK